MVARFNALADSGALDFEAWFSRRTETGRSWAIEESDWRFSYRYVPSLRFAGRQLARPPMDLLRKPPDVLVGFYSEPAMLAGVHLARLRGAKTALWAQVTPAAWQRRKPWKERIKHFTVPRVDATFGHGQDSRAFAMRYGASAEQARALPHAVNVEFFEQARGLAKTRGKLIRQALGVKGYCVLYVGRLWEGKGVFDLLQAFEAFHQQHPDSTLLFVGDGVDQQRLAAAAAPLGRHVRFAGFLEGQALLDAYAAADVFAFPSHGDPYGLVVDEALATGLPVIASDAAGEIRERLPSDHLYPAHDVAKLVSTMSHVKNKNTRRASQGLDQSRPFRPISPAQWAANFEQEVFRLVEE